MQDKFSFCLERVPTPAGCMLLITDSDNIVRAIDWEGYEERMHRLLRLHYGAGAHPVGVVVPCHRVIGADASLTGHGGGLGRKRWLLEHEGARPPVEVAAPTIKKAGDEIWFARQTR
jgi:O6-methylguanine-DNA--protein-cysteine methyltransferase